MNFYVWTGLVNTLTTVAVGVFVITRRAKDPRHITFGLFALSVAWWSAFYCVWLLSKDKPTALLFIRLCTAGCVFIHACFFHHILVLTRDWAWTHLNRLLLWIGYASSAVLSLSSLTPLGIPDVRQKLLFPYWPDPGGAYKVYTALFVLYVSYATTLIYQGYRRTSGPLRLQFRYLFFGTVIAFIGGATNFFLWYDVPILPVGNVVVPFYLLLTALAVIRYQFMDIKVVITRTGLLLVTYLIVLGVPFLLGWLGRPWLENVIGREWWLVPLGLCTVLATAGPFAYASLRRQAERRFLKEQRRYQRTLQLAARGMTQVRNVTRLANLITRLVSRTVGMTHASLFLWDQTRERYVLSASHGSKRLAPQSRYGLEVSHPLVAWLSHNRRILTEGVVTGHNHPVIAQELANLGAELVIPGLIEHRLIGLLVLGPKLTGVGYSTDDLHAFTTLANEAAVAVENAMSYEELIKVNEQLKVASERLLTQERLAAAGQFAAGMAHEIKNPLSAIKTFAQYLPEKYSDPTFREKFFRIVQDEIDRINTIVKELSDFAKPAPLQLQPVRLPEVVEDTLSLLSNQCLKQGVVVHKSFGEDGLMIQADPQQLKQVLLNLFLNSLEAMAHGGRLEVSSQVNGRTVMLRIADSGSGIEPRHLGDVWDPFFTTKERGMGLGLAIVKGIIDRHGGRINLTSSSGKGTVVELSLPVSPAVS